MSAERVRPTETTDARRRREAAERAALRIHAFVNTWRCLGPGCRRRRYEGTPWFFFCSDRCRQNALDAERMKRGRAA